MAFVRDYHPDYELPLFEERLGAVHLPILSSLSPQAPRVREAKSFWEISFALTLLLLIAIQASTIVFVYPKQNLAVPPVPDVTSKINDVDAQFAKIGLVLNYLVDQTKNKELQPDGTASNVVPSPSLPNLAVTVGVITADKALLRTGPGPTFPSIMSLAKGSKLTVQSKSGDWLMVISPTGITSWISTKVFTIIDEAA